MTPATAILVPVLDRPEKVAPLIENIEAVTPEPHRILFLVSEGDDAERVAIHQARETLRPGECSYELVDEPGTWARKINVGFRRTVEPFVFLAADDVIFHRHWLDVALDVMENTRIPDDRPEPKVFRYVDGATPAVVGTNDLCNDRTMLGDHSTHTLVRRSYVEQEGGVVGEPGVLLFEGYPHEYADDELVDTAKSRGRYAHAYGSIVQHVHPLCDPSVPDDETYRRGRAGTNESYQLFLSRQHLWGGVRDVPRRLRRRMERRGR